MNNEKFDIELREALGRRAATMTPPQGWEQGVIDAMRPRRRRLWLRVASVAACVAAIVCAALWFAPAPGPTPTPQPAPAPKVAAVVPAPAPKAAPAPAPKPAPAPSPKPKPATKAAEPQKDNPRLMAALEVLEADPLEYDLNSPIYAKL